RGRRDGTSCSGLPRRSRHSGERRRSRPPRARRASMAGFGDHEVLVAGSDAGEEPGRAGSRAWTVRRVTAPALVVCTALLVGGLVGRATAPAAASPVPSSVRSEPSAGVVVPEVVDAETVAGTGGRVARPVEATPDGARYDYSLTGA